MNYYLILLLWAAFLFPIGNLPPQGSWDLKYVPESDISDNFKGKEIRIDFKRSGLDTLQQGWVNIRVLLALNDTVDLEINSSKKKFIESWVIYADHGVLEDQSLVCIEPNCDVGIIKGIFIESISEFEMTVKIDESSLMSVERSNIRGILVAEAGFRR